MLAKAIATGFNSPFVTIPGSGFAQTFIGMDAIIVRFLARKAKQLARKWGGQCIVFIDEIDAVGMRRQSLGGARDDEPARPRASTTSASSGRTARSTPSGDLVLETRAWRERLFEARAPQAPPSSSAGSARGIVNQGRRSRACSAAAAAARAEPAADRDGRDRQPAVLRAGADEPRQQVARRALRHPAPDRRRSRSGCRTPRPRSEPDLLHRRDQRPDRDARPRARRARAAWAATSGSARRRRATGSTSSTSTSTKVSHEEDLDTDEAPRRARPRSPTATRPAMIEQVCSMALTLRPPRRPRARSAGRTSSRR